MKLTAESTVFNDQKVTDKFAELIVDADGIRTEVGKKVGNDEVISRINQSAESVQIEADKVAIEADDYVTQFGSDGVKLHPKNDDSNYITISPTDGMDIYKGGGSVASFGSNVKVGTSSGYVLIQPKKISALGTGQYYAVGDLQGATAVHNYVGDGETKEFLIFNPQSTPTVTIDGTATTAFTNTNAILTFNTAPADGAKIVITYTYGSLTPYFTFGNRATDSIIGGRSFCSGNKAIASGANSHAEGQNTVASGNMSHAEGANTTASSYEAHSEGFITTASGAYSHAEGRNTKATKACSHAEGRSSEATGMCSHAEGRNTDATGTYSHAEGEDTKATGFGAHAEGFFTTAGGTYSHAEGYSTDATKDYSHSEGYQSTASGMASHAGGWETIAQGLAQVAIGQYNVASGNPNNMYGDQYLFIIGNGYSKSERSNAMVVAFNGNTAIAGTYTQSSDRRLKEHISYLDDDAVDFIRKLKPAYFKKDDQNHVGFYAQDVEEADKWDCMVGEMNGYKTLGYTELIAPLVAYCQHLEKRIEALEREQSNEH